MQTFNLKNFRQVRDAQFKLAPNITLFDGNNSAGKSTVLRGLKALFTGDVGTTKSKAHEMVTNGANKAVLCGNGVEMNFPKMTITGAPVIHISENAADIRDSVLLKSSKDAMLFFVDLLKASPTKQDLISACNFIEGKDRLEKINKIWDMIETVGWTGTEKNIREYASGQSSNWKVHTGENFGTAKAVNWKHKDYSFELDNLTENQIREALQEAKTIHEDAIAANAVSEERAKELEHIIAGEPEYLKEKEELRESNIENIKKQDTLKSAWDGRVNTMLDIKNTLPEEQRTIKCPCCDKDLVYVNGKLEEPKKLSEVDLQKIKDDLVEAIKFEQDAKIELDTEISEGRTIQKRITEIDNHLLSVNSARVELEKYDNSEGKITPSECYEEVERWEKLLTAYVSTRDAKKCHESYVYYKELEKVISVDGIRKTKVSEAVEGFNAVANQIFTNPKWNWRADSDFSVTDDIGTEYDNLSDGQKWCARVLFQVVSSVILGDEIILIDTIEKVDRDYLTELCMQLHKSNIRAVIASASDQKEKETLNIEKIPGCARYTLVDGVIK